MASPVTIRVFAVSCAATMRADMQTNMVLPIAVTVYVTVSMTSYFTLVLQNTENFTHGTALPVSLFNGRIQEMYEHKSPENHEDRVPGPSPVGESTGSDYHLVSRKNLEFSLLKKLNSFLYLLPGLVAGQVNGLKTAQILL